MEYVIKKIADIDKEAEKYKEANKNLIEMEKLKFETELKNLKEAFNKELLEEKRKLMDDKLKEASEEAENIRKKNVEFYNELMSEYLKRRDKLVLDIFNELKDSMKEGA